MSLIHEYGENKYNDGKDDGIEQIIRQLLKSGEDSEVIAEKTDVPLDTILEIKDKLNL